MFPISNEMQFETVTCKLFKNSFNVILIEFFTEPSQLKSSYLRNFKSFVLHRLLCHLVPCSLRLQISVSTFHVSFLFVSIVGKIIFFPHSLIPRPSYARSPDKYSVCMPWILLWVCILTMSHECHMAILKSEG